MGQPDDLKALSKVLEVPLDVLEDTFGEHFFPDRAKLVEMPPRDPVIYRLYEIVQVYGYAYKNIIAEKFGDGIMSAISFSTKIEKEEDDKGVWVKASSQQIRRIANRSRLHNGGSGCLILGSKFINFPYIDSQKCHFMLSLHRDS